MKTHLIVASGAALLLGMAPTAFAQSDSSGANTTMQSSDASGGGLNAGDITCRELTAMDTRTVPGVLYYISGYAEGQRSAGGQMSMNDSAGKDTSGSDAATTAGTDTASANQSGADATADTTSSTTQSDTAGNAGDASSGGQPAPQIAAIRGYFDIPVEQTMVACSAAPDSRASDVLEQQRKAGGGQGSTNAQ